jgi:2-amino-4-hydroxy-6-hydroxymethyldihydropteridine diphosphokinase
LSLVNSDLSFVRVYLGLGSNLADPLTQLKGGLAQISRFPFIRDFKCSSFFQTPPLAGMDQPDYINCVCCFESNCSALDLLGELKKIEDEHGRSRSVHWGARTLDIDILLYGQSKSNEKELILPHPGIEFREFVLVPLLELSPELNTLNGRSYQSILDEYYLQFPSQLKVLS